MLVLLQNSFALPAEPLAAARLVPTAAPGLRCLRAFLLSVQARDRLFFLLLEQRSLGASRGL